MTLFRRNIKCAVLYFFSRLKSERQNACSKRNRICRFPVAATLPDAYGATIFTCEPVQVCGWEVIVYVSVA